MTSRTPDPNLGALDGATMEAPSRPPKRDDLWVPWSGKARRVDIVCWAGVMLSGIFYWATLPFRASLVGTHPVLLELMNGSTEAIIAAGAFARVGHGTLIVVLLAAIPGLMKFDPLFWWAGRLWGERVIALLGGRRNRGARYMGRVRRWGRKFTWPAVIVAPFLPIPTAIIYVIAGSAGMRLFTFLILDAIGTLLWAGTLAGLGYAVGHHAVVVAQTISHYGLWISIGLVIMIVFFQVRSQRRMAAAAAADLCRAWPRTGSSGGQPRHPGSVPALAPTWPPGGERTCRDRSLLGLLLGDAEPLVVRPGALVLTRPGATVPGRGALAGAAGPGAVAWCSSVYWGPGAGDRFATTGVAPSREGIVPGRGPGSGYVMAVADPGSAWTRRGLRPGARAVLCSGDLGCWPGRRGGSGCAFIRLPAGALRGGQRPAAGDGDADGQAPVRSRPLPNTAPSCCSGRSARRKPRRGATWTARPRRMTASLTCPASALRVASVLLESWTPSEASSWRHCATVPSGVPFRLEVADPSGKHTEGWLLQRPGDRRA